jgi:hypothetical protein
VKQESGEQTASANPFKVAYDAFTVSSFINVIIDDNPRRSRRMGEMGYEKNAIWVYIT